jgi:phosphoribosylaminoimidazole carboxylase (NCAIR synthetase)
MQLAKATVATFKGAGVFAVEMFHLPDDSVLVRVPLMHAQNG